MRGSSFGPRARLAAAVLGGVAAVTTAVAMGWGAAQPAGPASAPLTEEQANAECLRTYDELSPDSAGQPDHRLTVRDGHGQLRVYVSEPPDWVSTCRIGESGVEQTFGTVMEDGPADRIRLFGADDAVVKARLLIGRLPAGATAITAELPSGRTLAGTRNGDLFVVWAPDTSVADARLTASRPDGTVVATGAAPRDPA